MGFDREPHFAIVLVTMMRIAIVLTLLFAFISPASADEPVVTRAATPKRLLDAAREAEFAGWVKEGDDARAEGKPGRAANAYFKALAIHEDALVAGRLGMMLVQLKKPAEAVDLLLAAIERGFMTLDKEERRAVIETYEIARAQVTWLNVRLSHVGVKVTIDGKERNSERFSAFSIFIMPGEHEFRATLPGHKDAVVIFTATPGGEQTLDIELVPLPGTIAAPPRPLLRKRWTEDASPAIRDLELPPDEDEPQSTPIYGGIQGAKRPDIPRISIEGGPIMVLGVATWRPAVGAVIGIRWRAREYLSLGLEGRAAWLTSGITDRPLNAMTVGGIASLCGHWRWLYGCGLGHLGIFRLEAEPTTYEPTPTVFFRPGWGLRIGGHWTLPRGFFLGSSFDLLRVNAKTKVFSGQTLLVDQAPFLIGGQVLGGWEF